MDFIWNSPNFLSEFIRGFFSVLDSIGYFFLSGIFNIFFIIANATFFQGDVINEFYSRVQLILGLLMVFRLSITLLQIILNPDMFKDKQKGAGSLVKRIALMLVMLSLIVPIEGIPKDDPNPLNIQIRNNGVLFGFLYQFQNSVVQDNVLGKLILGSKTDSLDDNDGSLQLSGMENVGDVISADIAKAFITPTLKDGFTSISSDPEADDYVDKAAACPDAASSYLNPSVSSGALLDHINDTCNDNGEVYAFSYTGFGGVVVAIVMTIIIIGFTLDIAVRAIKLAILRLIAPVPIISYISPGQEKDGAFGNWVKTLTSTYLSLFIRLIIIYFGIYLIIILREGDLVTLVSTGNLFTSALANIFIIIGILVFMKDAPKFFQDMLGIKGDGKLFSGIGTMLGAAALTGGLAGSIATNYRAARDEVLEDGGSKRRARAMGALSGVGGAVGGLFAGGKALATADKKQASAVFSAMQRRNAVRTSGASLPRRAITGLSAMTVGQAPGARDEAKLKLYDDFISKSKAQISMAEEESLNDTTATGAATVSVVTGRNADGSLITQTMSIAANYRDLENRFQNARASGASTFNLNGFEVELDSVNGNVFEALKKDQAYNWALEQASMDPNDDKYSKKFAGTTQELEYAASTLQVKVDAHNYKDVKGKMGIAMNEARDARTDTKRERYRAAAKEVGASSGKK